MKRICFVDYDMSVTGGAEQVTASLVNVLCSEYKVYVCTLVQCNDEMAYHLDESIRCVKLLGTEERLRMMKKKAVPLFIKFVRDHGIEIVIMMGNYPAFVISAARMHTKAKYIYCDHGALMNQWKQKDITFIRFVNTVFAHKVVVLTERTRKDYIKQFHLKESKVQCIYNWIDTKVLNERKTYDAETHKILTVGRFGKEKGYDLLLKVAKKVLPDHPEWEWHLYGEGETFEKTKREIQETNLDKQLVLQGNVKDVYKKFNQYAFLVLTSYREGLPLVLLEANAIGIPMVSFDIATGPNEIIDDGMNGFLITPYDTDEMAEKIERLVCSRELRIDLAKATEYNLVKFEQGTILQQWIELIENV